MTAKEIGKDIAMWLSRKINYPLIPPDMLQLCFTFRCNLRCKMCNMHDKLEELKGKGRPYELSFSLMKDLILQAHNMKIKEVYFVGGEPLIEEKIFHLIAYATQLNMRTVVNTNGVLVDGEKISKILNSGLSYLVFSIDGPDKETYESIRGERIFDKVSYNLKNLIEKRNDRNIKTPQITILCTIMKQNAGKLPDMVRFARNIGVDSINFQPVVPDNTDQSTDYVSDTWINPEMYGILDDSIDSLISLKNNGFSNYITSSVEQLELVKLYFRRQMSMVRKCYIGFSRLIVTQDYRLYFCAPNPKNGDVSFGDVSKTSLRKLWKSREAKRFRGFIKKCKRPCLLFCAYRPEFDAIIHRFSKIIKKFGIIKMP